VSISIATSRHRLNHLTSEKNGFIIIIYKAKLYKATLGNPGGKR